MPLADDDGPRLPRLRDRFATAARRDDRGALGDPTQFIDATCALIVALVDELAEDEADAVLGQLAPLLAGQARLEIETRRRLARELEQINDRDRAIAQLTAAHERARTSAFANIEAELARELDAMAAKRSHPRIPSPVVTAEQETDPERAAALELELSRRAASMSRSDEAVLHARKSLDYANETVDRDIIAASITHLAELLADRGELVEAKALLEERPLTRDGRAARALYDHIRRALGQPPADPPEEPDEPGEPLAPAIRAYFTRPQNLARAIIEGALPGSPQLSTWPSGTVTKASELDSETVFGPVRSFWCACGFYRGREYSGMHCHRCGVEIIHASARRTRVGILALARPVLHPWYVAAAGVLLEVPPEQLLAVPIDRVRAQLDALDEIDLALLREKFKQAIVTAPRAKLADEAGRKLALVDALQHARGLFETTPGSLVIDRVLVAPPAAELGFDRVAVRAAYARILDGADPHAVAGLFDALARKA